MRIRTNGVEIIIRKTKTTNNENGLNILLTSKYGKEDSLCHIIPNGPDSQVLVFNKQIARKHKVGFETVDNSW